MWRGRDEGSVTTRRERPQMLTEPAVAVHVQISPNLLKEAKVVTRNRSKSDPVALSWDFNIFWHPPHTAVTYVNLEQPLFFERN